MQCYGANACPSRRQGRPSDAVVGNTFCIGSNKHEYLNPKSQIMIVPRIGVTQDIKYNSHNDGAPVLLYNKFSAKQNLPVTIVNTGTTESNRLSSLDTIAAHRTLYQPTKRGSPPPPFCSRTSLIRSVSTPRDPSLLRYKMLTNWYPIFTSTKSLCRRTC
jgi:hypothetical protein